MKTLTRLLPNKLHESVNALQTRCYMCMYWTHVLYSVVITWQSNPPNSQFNSPCNEFTSVWSMFVYNTCIDLFNPMNVPVLCML